MLIDLNEKMQEHLHRIELLAKEAAEDAEETFAQRASAMTAMTAILREMEKMQAEVLNMERLMIMEQTTIELLKKHLTEKQQEEFLRELKEKLDYASGGTINDIGMDY
jgi:hypothetical protein